MHSGAPSSTKRALCKQKKGTLYTNLRKSRGHVPPVPPLPKSMIVFVIVATSVNKTITKVEAH